MLVNKLQVIFLVAVLAQPYLGDPSSFLNSSGNLIFTMVNPINKWEKLNYPFLLHFFSSAFNVCVLSCLLFFNCPFLKLVLWEKGLSDSTPGLILYCGCSAFPPLVLFPLCEFYSSLLSFVSNHSIAHLFFCVSSLFFVGVVG